MANLCVFGDSITWGSWDPIGGGWVGRLREAGANLLYEKGDYVEVYNCGIPGDKLKDLLVRFETEAIARRPQAIAIAIGINDIQRFGYKGTSPDAFASQYQQLITKARRHAEDIVAITPTNVDELRPEHDYRNSKIESITDLIRSIAEEEHLPLIDVFGHMTPEDLEPDGLHPGSTGHQKLFEIVSPQIFSLPSLAI